LKSKKLAEQIARLMLEKKGIDIIMMDLQGVTNMTDYFVICSVDSDVQAKAIMDHITDELVYESVRPWHVEGMHYRNWILLDFVDVVVHIFQKEAREFYSLERLWGDAEITAIKDDDETSGIHTR